MKRILLLFNLLLVLSINGQTQRDDFIVKKYLVDLNNRKVSLLQYINNQPFVIVFMAAECPISQKYAPILSEVKQQYPKVSFLSVFTKWDKSETIQDYLNNYPLSMPVLRDKKNGLVGKIDARITPEAFLFDKNGVLIYRGAIDNWFYALGKYRPEATERYLVDAIQQFFKNEPIKIKQTDAVGCIIEK